MVVADKERKGHDERAEIIEVMGEVDGRDVVLVDDFTISAGTADHIWSRDDRHTDP
jgi:ribose-phosphate pyrophosphokinase